MTSNPKGVDYEVEYLKLCKFYRRDGVKELIAQYWPDMALVDRASVETPALRKAVLNEMVADTVVHDTRATTPR